MKSDNATRARHIAKALEVPRQLPEGFELDPHEVAFDPRLHLALDAPNHLVSSGFRRDPFPLPVDVVARGDYSLGYSAPFRVLSDSGVKALNSIIHANEIHAKSNERIPKCLRGLGYRSQFVRDLTYSPEVIKLLSAIAGKPLAPHGMPMNMAHVNFGKTIAPGSAAPVIVDVWHVDSVDYVLVLILSDLSETVGGELQVLHKDGVRDNADFMKSGVSKDMQHLVRSVAYPGAGYAIFMQGSQILHRVSPVLSALEPRISCECAEATVEGRAPPPRRRHPALSSSTQQRCKCMLAGVTSYMSRNVFDADTTRYHTFAHQDPQHVTPVEFCRHQAWRVGGIMDFIRKDVPWGTPPAELAAMLRKAAATLERTARLVNKEEDDILEWIDHEKVQSKL